MAALMLQNRMLGDTRVVLAWPMDTPEAHCASSDPVFADPVERVIVAGTDRCQPHAGAETPCPLEWQTPPLCQHGNVLPQQAGAESYRCDICGLGGSDESGRYLRRMTGSLYPSQPDETYTEYALGEPEIDHSSLGAPERS